MKKRYLKSFNENILVELEYEPIQEMQKEFSVVKVVTKTGIKVMMCYTCDCGNFDSIIDNVDFETACKVVEEESETNGIEKFDRKVDVIVGAIPSYMLDKKSVVTSYKPKF